MHFPYKHMVILLVCISHINYYNVLTRKNIYGRNKYPTFTLSECSPCLTALESFFHLVRLISVSHFIGILLSPCQTPQKNIFMGEISPLLSPCQTAQCSLCLAALESFFHLVRVLTVSHLALGKTPLTPVIANWLESCFWNWSNWRK